MVQGRITTLTGNIFVTTRTDVLSLAANLYANVDIELPGANSEVRPGQR